MTFKNIKVQPHGTRSCYVAGCRCELCRAANTAYYHENKKRVAAALAANPHVPVLKICPGTDSTGCPEKTKLRKETRSTGLCKKCQQRAAWNGYVSAEKSRAHILELSKHGVGRRQLAGVCKVSLSVLMKIKKGQEAHVRVSTERRILAVTTKDLADHAYVPAGETWHLISLLRHKFGMSKAEIARELGYDTPTLQLKTKRILKKNADEVVKLYSWILEEKKMNEEVHDICTDCGRSHRKKGRFPALRVMLPCTVNELMRAYPCIYQPKGEMWKGSPESRMLYRDLHEIGAVLGAFGEWYIPKTKEQEGTG